ncbi:MAG: N-acyl homoserine lactonase family protein [Deltaproteobacteria bacterium]|nr:N-acyl homoserine lactonase family protein [Deltaproteobacteria bacterium]
MSITIHPLNTGFIALDKGVYITGGHDYGQEVEVPCNAFLIKDGESRILVDTGMEETQKAHIHHPGSYQPEGSRIDQRLAELDVSPEEIEAVLFTHLHWDHCANMKLFRNARFFVHRKELEFALDPHILYLKSYDSEKLGMTPPFKGVEFTTVEGDYAYNDRISMFPTPGHCPGHQSVAVKTDGGLVVIAGDAVFADENMVPDEHRGLPFTPMGRFVSVFEMYDSMVRILDRADRVLTAHGTGVYDQDQWP